MSTGETGVSFEEMDAPARDGTYDGRRARKHGERHHD